MYRQSFVNTSGFRTWAQDEFQRFWATLNHTHMWGLLSCVCNADQLTFPTVPVVDSLTTSLSPLKPFPLPPVNEPTVEVMEFEGVSEKDVHPYTTFLNHLYVYPQSLSFDTQRSFTRARNIACVVELRDSDCEGVQPLCVSVYVSQTGNEMAWDWVMYPVCQYGRCYPVSRVKKWRVFLYITIFEQLMALACRCLKHVVYVNICTVLCH